MSAAKFPVTPAVRQLRQKKVLFEPRLYRYEEHGGTAVSARELGVEEHRVIKTLVFEDDSTRPLIVLMHGDRQVSTRELARVLGVRTVRFCRPDDAHRHTGYQVGGTSPFGTKKALPVYCEESIFTLESILINGGKRGFLVELAVADLRRVLEPTPVRVAQQEAD